MLFQPPPSTTFGNISFDSKNVHALVEAEAIKRIDATANDLIQKNVTNSLAPIRLELINSMDCAVDDIQRKVSELNTVLTHNQEQQTLLRDLIADGRLALSDLKEQSGFLITVIETQNDNRLAYEQLLSWAADTNFKLQNQALDAVRELQIAYGGDRAKSGFSLIEWQPNVNPAAFSAEQLAQVWPKITKRFARDFLRIVWENTNTTREFKTYFIHSIMTNSHGSLLAANQAAVSLSSTLQVSYNPSLVFDDIERAWQAWAKTNNWTTPLTNAASIKH